MMLPAAKSTPNLLKGFYTLWHCLEQKTTSAHSRVPIRVDAREYIGGGLLHRGVQTAFHGIGGACLHSTFQGLK